MFFLRLVMTALRSLESHFLRTLLATLGVLIGVASVVACMSILEGASNEVIRDVQNLGGRNIYIAPEVARVQGRTVGAAQTLTNDDVTLLERELPQDIQIVSGEVVGNASIKRFQKSGTYSVMAVSEAYFIIHDFSAELGRTITKSEASDELALVVCLGHKVAEQLFGGMDPVGQTVKVGSTAYRVIGVMEKRGNTGFINADESVFIPLTSGLKRFFNRRWLSWLTVQVKEGRDLDEVQKAVAKVLRRSHRIRPGQTDDFRVLTQEQILQQVNEASMIFKVVFYSIVGISLLVGGIGIMNIMLVSVTERTREIGVRMAVGAKRGDILIQFLVEALIISLLGGGFGLLLGVMTADLLDKVMKGIFETEITWSVLLIALATTMFVGIVSGLYPAYKASRLDPVEALRYE